MGMMKMEKLDKLHASLSIPSYENSYSLAVGFMRDWFIKKFNDKYFKSFHIVGKHVLDDFKRFNINDSLKKETPALSMKVDIDYDYDRDGLDTYEYGLDTFVRKSKFQKSFFKDTEKNLYLGIEMEQIRMNCAYRIKLSEKAQQLRMYKYMQMAMKVGGTWKFYIDCDFHIPYSLIMQIANDSRFEIENDDVKDKVNFLRYLNMHSQVPVIMKFANMTGKVEYFLRFSNLFTHIQVPNKLSVDEGEQQGKIFTNFMIEMEAEVLFPSPKMYIYYSCNEHNLIDSTNTLHHNNVSLDLCTIKIPKVDQVNLKGWERQLEFECEEEDLSKPLEIDLSKMLCGTDIIKIIHYNNSIMVSSNVFLDFKLYNDGEEVDYDIDWQHLKIICKNKLRGYITNVYVYLNLEYFNAHKMNANKYYLDRYRIEQQKKK